MNRRLARLEARARPAPGPEDDERAREELARRLDRLRQYVVAGGYLHEDGHLDGEWLGDDPGDLRERLEELLQDHRARRLAGAVAAFSEEGDL